MTISELPQEVQEQLARERENLCGKVVNTPYNVKVYDAQGRRYFDAYRHSISSTWAGFGGGSYWKISYGAVQFSKGKDPFGGIEYHICDGKTYRRSANGTDIPSELGTKKEVLELIKKIGIFSVS